MKPDRKITIAIDGPAGAGKSTVAREVARRLDLKYLDTEPYEQLLLKVIRAQLALDEPGELEALLGEIKIEFGTGEGDGKVFLNGEDVTAEIRGVPVNKRVSEVSSISMVRKKMVALQREIAVRSRGIVVEGRDICSRVLPEADFKFYLEARLSERALRRWKEQVAGGMKVSLGQVQDAIKMRDSIDSQRRDSPLTVAPGVTVIDTTELSLEAVINKVLSIVNVGGTAVEGE